MCQQNIGLSISTGRRGFKSIHYVMQSGIFQILFDVSISFTTESTELSLANVCADSISSWVNFSALHPPPWHRPTGQVSRTRAGVGVGFLHPGVEEHSTNRILCR